MTQVICFSNFKGGTGKTSTVYNLGHGIANRKKKVLLIDNDPQHNLTQGLGITEIEQGMHDIYLTDAEIKPISISKYIDFIPSSVHLIEAEMQLISMFKREFVLSKKIDSIKNNYDYILIDCPPSLGVLTQNALIASDLFFVPIEPEPYAFNGLNTFNNILDKMEIDIDNIIITKYDSRMNLHKDIAEAINDYLPGKVFKTWIHKNVSIAEAVTATQDIFTYNPKSTGAVNYKKLAGEFLKLYN